VVLGASLAISSVAALGAAGTFYFLGRSDEKDAQAAPNWGAYFDPADRARIRQRWALGFLGAGVLLGGAALVEWIATTPRGPSATAWVMPGGAGLALRGRY
jgi:hypothetical protein